MDVKRDCVVPADKEIRYADSFAPKLMDKAVDNNNRRK